MEENIKYNLDYMQECYSCITKNRNTISQLRKNIEEDESVIKKIVTSQKTFCFICDKLQEAIDKFDLNKNKEDNLYDISKCSSCSTDGEYKEWEYKTENPNSKFNPYIDKWEITAIETKDSKYKIQVENIKGRKHLIAGYCWEPDYYSTDWFEI